MKISENLLSLALRSFLIVLACFSPATPQSGGNEKETYVDLEIKDGKLFYTAYKSIGVRTVDLSDVEVWEKAPKSSPVNVFLSGDPAIEFKVTLLRRGIAKLRDGVKHEDRLVEAQNVAKKNMIGIWGVAEPASQVPGKEGEVKPASVNFDLKWILEKIIAVGKYVGVIAGLTILYNFFKRRKLYIVMLGMKSSGKSTIFKRLFHPEDKPEECFSPKATMKTERKPANEELNWGRYVVKPVYIDTPGGEFGEQASEMLKKDSLLKRLFFKRSKYVWMITLAPTDDHRVLRSSREEDKANLQYINWQQGYLSFPIAFLTGKNKSILGTSKPIAKPDLVILCVNKSDLFSDSQGDENGKKKLKEMFKAHISLVENACTGKFKFSFQIVSACEGWDVHLVKRIIERELY